MGIEPTQASIEAEFPGWQAFPRVSGGLVYGRRVNSSPPILVRGEDWRDLRDEIMRAEARIAQRVYWDGMLAERG